MANKKLNEVTTTSTLGDNDYITCILANGDIVKVKKSNLYPVATTTSNGLMKASDKQEISDLTTGRVFIMQSGEEIEFPFQRIGTYFIFYSDAGVGSIAIINSFATSIFNPSYEKFFSGILNTTDKICLGRRETNGTIFLQNNRNTTVTVRIEKM